MSKRFWVRVEHPEWGLSRAIPPTANWAGWDNSDEIRPRDLWDSEGYTLHAWAADYECPDCGGSGFSERRLDVDGARIQCSACNGQGRIDVYEGE